MIRIESGVRECSTLYQLFANGWEIYNSNGDQHISLSNKEKKVKESDAFVFMPGASLKIYFRRYPFLASG
ncbi:MAG: hypothetical protein CMI18_04375 [Opitutaceae bacterium]|nr:hypothetical protein [Opitutaceae bacterium]|tara:strand:+ start:1221 stop:1430 length:210 start_codon:yes stop_codon:yes gene_type:complete